MQKEPLLSIVVPVFNRANFIEKCFQYIQEQKYKNIEVIFVDEGSNDNSVQIIKQLKKKYKNISLLKNKSKGLLAGRFLGFEKANGQYLASLDCDDFINNNFYYDMITKMQGINTDLVMSDSIMVTNGRKIPIPLIDCFGADDTILNGDGLGLIFKSVEQQTSQKYVWTSLTYVWNKVFTRDLYKRIQPFFKYFYKKLEYPIVAAEDIFMTSILLDNAKKMVYCPSAKYFYIQHGSQTTKLNIENKLFSNTISTAYAFKYIKQYLQKTNKFDRYQNLWAQWAEYQLEYYKRHSYKLNCNLKFNFIEKKYKNIIES